MTERTLVWTTDRNLQVTSLSARLRNLLFAGGAPDELHVSELWNGDDAFGVMLVSHQWALEGDCIEFEAEYSGMRLRIRLEPLYDLSGAIAGVGGNATPAEGEGSIAWDAGTLEEVERACGFGTWRTDARGVSLFSAGVYAILGLHPSESPVDLRRFDHPDDAETVARTVREGEISGSGYRCDHRIVRADGTIRHIQEHATVMYKDGVAAAVVGSLLDITDRKAAEARLAHLAHYDPVSKLPNRTLLDKRLSESLARAEREGHACAVLFLDVDDFKSVNDRFGHAAGDELLAAIGTRLSQHVRGTDTVARMSGDEFVVVLDGLSSPADAQNAARAILKSFERPFQLGGRDCRVGASIGVAVYPQLPVAAATLVDIADREMYVVKRNGGRGIKTAAGEQERPQGGGETDGCATSSTVPCHLRSAASG